MRIASSSSPMARLPARLDHLFQTVRAPDGGEYTYRQVAVGIERLVGWKFSTSHLQSLRMGDRTNPSMRHLHGLCAFFGVPIGYFFDEEIEARVDDQLELAASLRDPAVRQLAMSAAGLSPEALHSLTQMVEHARRLEGLDVLPGGAAPPESSRAVFRPVRRGRRARVRARETPAAETSPAHEAL
jgi:transcriptional regulator with XRE-family HTH domain